MQIHDKTVSSFELASLLSGQLRPAPKVFVIESPGSLASFEVACSEAADRVNFNTQ